MMTRIVSSWCIGVWCVVAAVPFGAAGCGGGDDGDGGGPSRVEEPLLALDPAPSDGRYVIPLAGVAPGEATTVETTIRDIGEAPLTIGSLDWSYAAPEGADETAPAFVCLWGEEGRPCAGEEGLPTTIGVLNGGSGLPEGLRVRVRFTRPADDGPREATLTIGSDSRDGDVVVRFATDEAVPRARVTPDHLRFKGLQRGEEGVREATVWNGGSAALRVDRLSLTGDADFVVSLGDEEWTATEQTRAGVAIEPPVVLAPDRSVPVRVSYVATDRGGATGTLALHTNDPGAPWATVRLEAVATGPVLDVRPQALPFGARYVGREAALPLQLLSRGTEPVTVTGAAFSAESSPDFSVTQRDGAPLDELLPLVIAPNDAVEVAVRYLPDGESERDELTGDPVLDEGTLVVDNDGFDPRLEVPVDGWGVAVDCPLAVILCEEGEEVEPQTVLHLDGSQSVGRVGRVSRWEWGIVSQPGTGGIFLPGPTHPTPTFSADAVGTYVFSLDVWDESGQKSCETALYEVVVVSTNAIHVELLWTTPGDVDETDEGPFAGADVDLHLLHEDAPSDPAAPDLDGDGAPDPWFDQPFDCYWLNPRPSWGAFASTDDDPRLDRDDTDGAGPENINLDAPEAGVRYTVAVHYWNDHGFGASFASVRFYLFGQPVAIGPQGWASENVRLVDGDLWCVAHVDWPSGEVTPCEAPGGGPWIVPSYRHPMFFD